MAPWERWPIWKRALKPLSSISSFERMKGQPKPLAWFVRCGLSAAVVLLACGIATSRLGRGLQLPATTARDGALVTLNRYIVDHPIPDIVLVGSSLTFRLKEEYFETPRLRNLALAGGSAVTGLQIVANRRQLPKLIVVETNMLPRPPDAALVKLYSSDRVQQPLFFRPVRTAIAAYENWMHAPVTHAQVEASLHRLVEQPPSSFDNHVYVERTLRNLDEDDPASLVKANVEVIGRLIDALEHRGVRVLLMEMPYDAPIEASRYVRIMHDIVHQAFPDPSRWIAIELDRADLRWADGGHLDERSAVIVSRYLDENFFSKLAYPCTPGISAP
jgi:hypothetical protein